MSEAGSSSANAMEAKRLQLNLKVLQRHDPQIVEILDSTSYVVLYRYVPAPQPGDADSQDSGPDMQWTKTSLEGSMFIYRRSVAPHYGFFILNRHGVENLNHYLEDENNLELTPEYIIVQSGDDQIKGIWIFEEDHRDRLGQMMLDLSRLSKQGSSIARAAAAVPLSPPSNNSPGSTGSSKPLPSGQSISLDMLFGNAAGGNGQGNGQRNNNGHPYADTSINLWEAQNVPAVPQALTQQGANLLDSLFADLTSGNASSTAKPSPTLTERVNEAHQNIGLAANADEDALRTLLGLAPSQSPQTKHANLPVPGQSFQQPPTGQYQGPPQPPQGPYALPAGHNMLAQSQRGQQLPFEPLAPRPQRMAQFDSVTYEPPSQPQIPAPSFGPSSGRQQAQQPAPPLPQPPPPQVQQQQHFVSAPLMPSVILNKAKPAAQSSPQSQQRQAPQPQQLMPGPPSQYSSVPGQPYASSQYSQTQSSTQQFQPPQRALSPPVLRVKSPLRQSHTYYSSSEYSEPRWGAQSIPPPPVPPVESRPHQPPTHRLGSGDQHRNALSPRASPQRNQEPALPSPSALDVLSESLKNTTLYSSQSGSQNAYGQPIPIDRYTFKQHLFAYVQDERFFEALYLRYLDHLEGK